MPSTRDPRVATLFGILAASSSRAAFGMLPPSLSLSPVLGQLAAIGICVGSFLVLVGMFWRDRDDGILIEQVGNACAGFGSMFYAVALCLSAKNLTDAAIVVGYSGAVFAGCTVRYFQIQRYIHRRKRAAEVSL